MADFKIELDKGKKTSIKSIVEEKKIVKVRVYGRGKRALGFDKLYAWLFAKSYLKYGERVSFWRDEIIKDMKHLNENWKGIHPSSISISDFIYLFGLDPGFEKNATAIEQMKIALSELDKPVKDNNLYNKLFTEFLDPHDFVQGWLADAKNEKIGQTKGKKYRPKCKPKLEDSYPDNTTNDVYQVLKPNMIVQSFSGGANDNVRVLINPKDEAGSTDHSLGVNGWAIIGFDCGFKSGKNKEVRVAELHTGEWMDIWVLKAGENPRNNLTNVPVMIAPSVSTDNKIPPVYYKGGLLDSSKIKTLATGTNNYHTALKKIDHPTSAKSQLTPTRIAYTSLSPPAATMAGLEDNEFVCSEKILDNWFYVGTVKGSGGTGRSVQGPHLGNLPDAIYHYLLIVDVDGIASSSVPGADIGQIGITLLDRVSLEEGYFLLVIDDSKSIAHKRSDFEKSVKEQVVYWMEEYNEVKVKYLGIRLIRWKNAMDEKNYSKKDKSPNADKDILDKTDYDAEKNKTNRVQFTTWLDITGYKDYSPAGKKLEIKDDKWVKFEKENKKHILVFLDTLFKNNIKMDSSSTPLVEALDDVLDIDMKGLPDKLISGLPKKPLFISIFSDGVPDPVNETTNSLLKIPYNQNKWICKSTVAYILNSNKADITGNALNELIKKKPKTDYLNDKSYGVESKLKRISLSTISSTTQIIADLTDIVSKKDEIHWVEKIYKSPRMKEFVTYKTVKKGVIVDTPGTYIDHSEVHHAHCDRGNSDANPRGHKCTTEYGL